MPRRSQCPRLYLDKERGTWTIRDGGKAIRTGCVAGDHIGAEKALESYLGLKHKPKAGPNPLISNVLTVYGREYVPHTKSAQNTGYNLASLARFWGDQTIDGITARRCREYASGRTNAAARRDLEVLRAALNYWNDEHGPLGSLPTVALPPKSDPRSRWLTRSDAARLLLAAGSQHLRRFILIGLYTGTRPGAILRLRWDQIDMNKGVMRRRATGETEDARKRAPPVRLGRRILSHMRRWARQDAGIAEYVCHLDGRPVAELRRSWPAAVKKAGLAGTGVTPHCLRRTRATWLMQAGIDLWEAAGHLGMTPKMLTEVYGQHHPDWQKKASEV